MLISTLRTAPEPARSRRAAEDVESVKRLVGLVAAGPHSALCSDSVTAFVGRFKVAALTLTFTFNTASYFYSYSNLYHQLII